MNSRQIKRGEIWWVLARADAVGGEIQKTRPAVVVSRDFVNRQKNRVTIVPLTSNVMRVHVSELIITAGSRQAKAMADQILVADKSRFTTCMGRLSNYDLARLEDALREHLEL